jgi:hypothetical protein
LTSPRSHLHGWIAGRGATAPRLITQVAPCLPLKLDRFRSVELRAAAGLRLRHDGG